MTALAVALGCQAPGGGEADGADAVVATYDGGVIRRSDIAEPVARRLARLPQPVAVADRQAAVAKVARLQAGAAVLSRQAEAAGLAGQPWVEVRARAREESVLAKAWLEQHVPAGEAITAERVAAEVEQRLAAAGPETRRFSHIFARGAASDPAARRAAELRIRQASDLLAAGEPFEEVARQLSDSITASRGGRVEWTTREALNRDIAELLFSLEEGQVSTPLAARDGLHLIRLDDIRRPEQMSREALAEKVRAELEAEARQAAVAATEQQVLDEAGAVLESAALAVPGVPDEQVVARAAGAEVTAADVRLWQPGQPSTAPLSAAAVKQILVNRLLAQRQRVEGIDPKVAARVERLRRAEVGSLYWTQRVQQINVTVSDEEVAAFYQQEAPSNELLRAADLDILFVAQREESHVPVYQIGEDLVRQLRDGVAFERLEIPAAIARERVIRRLLPEVPLRSLAADSRRVDAAVRGLQAGQVSEAVYVERESLRFGGAEVVASGPGLLFVRLRRAGALPLERAREPIREHLLRTAEDAAVEALRQELDTAAKLEILLPDG